MPLPYEAEIDSTSRLDYQKDHGSDPKVEEAKDLFREDSFDRSTLVGTTDAVVRRSLPSCKDDMSMTPEDDVFTIPYGPFVDKQTGRHMLELIKVTTVCLDDCEIYVPSKLVLDRGKVETLFRYDGLNFFMYVPPEYVEQRRRMRTDLDDLQFGRSYIEPAE
ncbi:hypothetical protein BDV37DRAFT_289807 [Aspergillus pseudonomiae]|uniref:Uncharacterized protein n=1 Tax=Aspergillus pseudonomiae TaxID=1506151 RepID=A0A5N7CS79_9EURO|nr:uncharacterized protein BDV37DRAFT_289807 [Aspergillus pseudonomiae]KAE8396995.1 hypothetical protein BDV37DRAFT_289807 [Aspergillus pseudonomiae]